MAEPFTFEEAIEPFTFEEAAPKPFSFEEATEAQTATVAQMAAATRHTLGVVGRAIAATDVALENRPEQEVEVAQPTDQWGRPPDPRGRNPAQLNPAWEGTRLSSVTGSEMLMRPLVEIPGIDFGILGPSQANVSTGTKVAAGAYNAAKTVPEFFTSLLGVSTLTAGGLPALVQRLVAGGFAVDLASHTPEQVVALAKAVESGDAQEISHTATSLGINVALAGLTAKHALRSSAPGAVVARALSEQVKATELADPNLAALKQVAPLTAEAVAKTTPIEAKPAEPFIAPVELKGSDTPLTTAAVESVKEPVANSRLAAEVPIQEPYSDKFSVSLQVATTDPAGISDAAVIASLPEALRGSVDSIRRFEGEVVPTNKAASIPGRVQIIFKDKASAQAAVDYLKEPVLETPTPTPAVATGESGTPPVPAGVPPAKPSVTPEVTIAKPEGERALTSEPLMDLLGSKHDLTAQQAEMVLSAFKSLPADAKPEALQKAYLKLALPADIPAEVGLGKVAGIKGAKEVLRDLREASSEPQGAIATPGPPLAPAATPAPVLPPKSQRQIITDIAKGLKLPIRFGRLRTNRFAGYFLPLQNLIGSKRANDIPIISHEAGHKLDGTFSFSNDPALRAELETLGDPAAIAGSRSSWTKSKTLKYKRGEGVAEFVRHWLTDPPAAAQHAPNMARAFELALDANKDFGTTMRQAQSDIQTWRNAEPQARLRSHISVGGNPNKTPYTADQLTRDLVDDLHFLRLAANDAKAAGTDLSPSQNPYTLARNLRGSYGMADSFIRSGVADFKTKEVTLGTSLQDALKPVAGRIADFRDWIIAKRAQELHGQGRQTGLVDSDVAFTATKFDGDAAFQDAFAKIKKWQDDLLQYAVDSDFVTPEGAQAMRLMNADYVPLHRVFEVGAGEAPAIEGSGTGRGLNVGKPGSLRRLTGSSRDIVDPLETMVRNAYAIITASEKHAINLTVANMAKLPDMGKWVEHIATPKERVQVSVEKLRDQLEANGADMTGVPDDVMLQFFQNSKQAPFGENVIKIVRDGKPEFYRLKRELFETFNALDLEDSGTLVRMMSAPSQVLRAGVVLDPSFALANVMRDAFTSAIVSRHGLLPFEATLRGVAAMLKSPKLVAEWEAAGGKNAIEANYFDRQKLQKFLSEKITKDLTPAERALIAVRSPLQALRWLTSLGEEATRIGEYQKAFEDLRKGGMSEGEARRQAAFESRDRQDFAKGGAKTKIPRRLAAFWNAGIQGNVRLAQAFREKPMQTTMKGLAFITIPKLIEQSLNWNDDDYWDRPQWERDLFFLIPIGKGDDGHTKFIRIPTPFEAGVIFGTFPGRILQSVRESSAENMKTFPAVLAKQTIPNPTPQWALTIFEDFMVGKKGYDVYRGRQIVPESIAQLPADMQWTEQTSLAARKLGAALGFPPVKIDHIINQTTGGLGKQVTHQIVDRAISLATGDERTAKGVVPGGRFVTTPAAVSSQAIDDFYTTLDRVKTAAEGQKKGRDDELARWKPMFTATESRMSTLRRQMRSTKDETQKDAIAEQILTLARDTMTNFKNQTK